MKKILIIGGIPFSGKYYTSRQYFALTCREAGWKVLYTEWMPEFHKIPFAQWRTNPSLTTDTPNLIILKMPVTIPGLARFKVVNKLIQMSYWYWLKKTLNILDWKQFKVVTFYPYIPWVVAKLKHSFNSEVTYYCVDLWKEFTGLFHSSKIILELEKQLLKYTDKIVVTARELRKHIESLNAYVNLEVSHGVDLSLYSKELDKEKMEEINWELRENGVTAKYFIYMGSIGKYTDLKLLEIILTSFPDIQFVIIGEVKRDSKSTFMALLKKFSNLHYLGLKKREVLPYYLVNALGCLNIFKQNLLTRAVNPLKIYEYTAGGKWIISTYMPELERLNFFNILLANTYHQFINFISKLLLDPPLVSRQEICKQVQEYSWENIGKNVLELIEG